MRNIFFILFFLGQDFCAEAHVFSNAKPEEQLKIETALAFLGHTTTGARQLSDLKGFSFKFEIDRLGDGNGSYDDDYNVLTVSEKSLKWPTWKLARLLCHELTHTQQDALGIDRNNYDNGEPAIPASGVSEFAALSMEVRFWVEAGAPTDTVRDFNMLRRQAYLFFPETVRIGWAYTNSSQVFKEPILAWADSRLAEYWDGVLDDEKKWRVLNAGKFPAAAEDKAIALEYLKERYKKPVSNWLPIYLENLGPLPGRPSANDSELIKLHRLLN